MEVVAPGMMVMTVIYFMGAVSGAHINPAVTVAFALTATFSLGGCPFYIAAQIIGAVLAAALLKSLFGEIGDVGATVPHHVNNLQLFVLETSFNNWLGQYYFRYSVWAGNVGKNGAIAIGGYIALSGLWAGL